jgi:hypothetical protein
MKKAPRTNVTIIDFPGLLSNVDPRDLPDGAATEQVNCASLLLGKLQVRQGIRPVIFEEDDD